MDLIKSIFVFLIFLLLINVAFANSNTISKKMHPATTLVYIDNIKNYPNKVTVVLEGKLVDKVGKKRYLLNDGTGSVILLIKDYLFKELNNPYDRVIKVRGVYFVDENGNKEVFVEKLFNL